MCIYMWEHYLSGESYVEAKWQEMIELLKGWELLWLKVAFEPQKTFSKRALADVLMHSNAPSLKQLGWEGDQQNAWRCELSSLRDLTSLLNECWGDYEASQALWPSGCSIRRKVRISHLKKPPLSGENATTGTGCPEEPVQLEWFIPSVDPHHRLWWFLWPFLIWHHLEHGANTVAVWQDLGACTFNKYSGDSDTERPALFQKM